MDPIESVVDGARVGAFRGSVAPHDDYEGKTGLHLGNSS
jgi:hypothetical protein